MDQIGAYRLLVGARSEIGGRRRNNQDSGFAGDRLILIADGVGGAPAGDVASALIVRTLAQTPPPVGHGAEAFLRQQLARANAQLAAASRADEEVRGMATTLTGLVLAGDGAFVVHIGDSRAYRMRDGLIEQITSDQSWVQMLIDHRMLPPEEADLHPMRHLLMHSLSGSVGDPDAARVTPVDLRPDDRWVLATDGVTDYLPAPVMRALISTTVEPQELADLLVEETFPVSKDNISVVVADVTRATPTGQGGFVGAAATFARGSQRAG